MAALFPITAVVVRRTLDTVTLEVEASSEAEAIGKAARVLEKFPQAHTVPGVPRCYIAAREPTEPEIIDIQITYPGVNDNA